MAWRGRSGEQPHRPPRELLAEKADVERFRSPPNLLLPVSASRWGGKSATGAGLRRRARSPLPEMDVALKEFPESGKGSADPHSAERIEEGCYSWPLAPLSRGRCPIEHSDPIPPHWARLPPSLKGIDAPAGGLSDTALPAVEQPGLGMRRAESARPRTVRPLMRASSSWRNPHPSPRLRTADRPKQDAASDRLGEAMPEAFEGGRHHLDPSA